MWISSFDDSLEIDRWTIVFGYLFVALWCVGFETWAESPIHG